MFPDSSAWSRISACPPTTAPLAKMQWLPTRQSWATWLFDHEVVVVADGRDAGPGPAVPGRHAAVDDGVFAEGVGVADLDAGEFALVVEVLRHVADDAAGVDGVVAAHRERADQVDVRADCASGAERDRPVDDGVRADGNVVGQPGLGRDDGGRVDARYVGPGHGGPFRGRAGQRGIRPAKQVLPTRSLMPFAYAGPAQVARLHCHDFMADRRAAARSRSAVAAPGVTSSPARSGVPLRGPAAARQDPPTRRRPGRAVAGFMSAVRGRLASRR